MAHRLGFVARGAQQAAIIVAHFVIAARDAAHPKDAHRHFVLGTLEAVIHPPSANHFVTAKLLPRVAQENPARPRARAHTGPATGTPTPPEPRSRPSRRR